MAMSRQGPVASVPAQVAPRTWSTLGQQAARMSGSQPGDTGVIRVCKDRPSVTSEVTHESHLESHRSQLQRASLGFLGKREHLLPVFVLYLSIYILSMLDGKAWLLEPSLWLFASMGW